MGMRVPPPSLVFTFFTSLHETIVNNASQTNIALHSLSRLNYRAFRLDEKESGNGENYRRHIPRGIRTRPQFL
ncbi:MAG: Uncharacterised protein [Gammaproteobacteria bacterium]|nr:MAG: Uncharacterised protein [Gammaproteobacteria bacterium]